MKFKARLKALERMRRESGETLRVVIQSVYGPPDLANSTCSRRIEANGALTEIVHLDGGREGLSEGDLEAFIASFPVEAPRERL